MKPSSLFSIGEVSKITGIHIKALRYYDRIGVFRPAYTDENSGYRYYRFEQLQNILAVRTCLDSGINLSRLEHYLNEGSIDYINLLEDASDNIDRKIELLQKRKVYLDFMKQEVSFNDKTVLRNSGECYGSIALWLTPFEGDSHSFDRKANYLKVAADAAKNGFQIAPLYFGMLMKCRGDERRIYLMAGLEDFLQLDAEHEQIFRTPNTWYSCAARPDLDVTTAESIWPEYFAMDYDKVVLATISIHSIDDEPAYTMFINKPPIFY